MNNKLRRRIGHALRERKGRAIEQFLELPLPVVLAILWLAGVALIGFVAVALYLFGALLWITAGA